MVRIIAGQGFLMHQETLLVRCSRISRFVHDVRLHAGKGQRALNRVSGA